MTFRALTIALAVLLPAPVAWAESLVIDFEDFALPSAGFLNNFGDDGGFTSNGAFFENQFTDFGSFTTWSDWSISNRGTPGLPPNPSTWAVDQFSFQYHSAAGGGRGGSGNFGMAFLETRVDPSLEPSAFIDLPELNLPIASMSAWFTNSTYTLLSIELGNEFALSFSAEDFLTLTIVGFSGTGGNGSRIGEVDFDLARGTSVVTDWTEVDLTPLIGSRSLGFRLSSSQTFEVIPGETYLSVPAYVAMDDLRITFIPEPATLAMAGFGLGGVIYLAVRRRRRAP
jgi:hypothetical protein